MKIAGMTALLMLFLPAAAAAEPTPLTVRAIAADGKLVGTSMGGARIVVRDADTGTVLAQGVTRGETGSTGKLVGEPHVRHAMLTGPGDAGFETVLDIDRPTRLSIEAFGPLAELQSATSRSTTLWVLPGKPPHGPDGLILELPGLAVGIVHPIVYGRGYEPYDEVEILANAILMCGCALSPGGLWNSDEYEVTYEVMRDGQVQANGPLTFAGVPSRFKGSFKPSGSGTYEVTVTAYHPQTGNAGVDTTTVVVP